jgi:diaminopimelate decarboxylase
MPMSKSLRERLFPVLPKIIAAFGTPFHIYDEEGITRTSERLYSAFEPLNEICPAPYMNCDAVKALPNPRILELLHGLGMGFDCSSVPELMMARDAGAKWDEIMFTSNNTSAEEFSAALGDEGCILNLDDLSFVDKVRDLPELVSFRYNPGKRRTGNSIIGNPFEAKYGITHEQLVPGYRKLKRRGVKRFGGHTMVCSNERNGDYIVDTVRMQLKIAGMLKKELGIELEFVNIGGGFGIPYEPEHKELEVEKVGTESLGLFRKFRDKHGFVPALYSECGRYVTGPHGVLVSRIINRKEIYKKYWGVDTGMPALMRPGMYGSYHHLDILDPRGIPRRGRLEEVSVVGAICENCDRLATDRMLPRSAREGDIVVTHDTGAHGLAMGFNYNGRLRPQELFLRRNGTVELIRRAETIDDLFRTLRFARKELSLAA